MQERHLVGAMAGLDFVYVPPAAVYEPTTRRLPVSDFIAVSTYVINTKINVYVCVVYSVILM